MCICWLNVIHSLGYTGLVRLMKGRSSRFLRQEFPSLKTRMPTLWTNSYFVSTVGGAPLASSNSILRTKSMSKQAYKFRVYPTGSNRTLHLDARQVSENSTMLLCKRDGMPTAWRESLSPTTIKPTNFLTSRHQGRI